MKDLGCFLLLSMLAIAVVGAAENQKNDADKRIWSTVNSAKETYVALHLLRGTIKLIFPDYGEFPPIKYHVPSSTPACQDPDSTLSAQFWINDNEYLKCKIKTNHQVLTSFVYEQCQGIPDNGENHILVLDGENIKFLYCFRTRIKFSYFEIKKSFMNLSVEGNLKCPAYFILPRDMTIASAPLKQADRLPLNKTKFPGQASDWWKKSNDRKLPKNIVFAAGNPTIYVFNTTKETRFSFRIGVNQVIPSFELRFDKPCNDATVSLYLNELVSNECAVIVARKRNGYDIKTKGTGQNVFIPDSTGIIFLMFVKAKLYVKVEESIQEFGICDISNFLPVDQFSLRTSFVERNGNECARTTLTIESEDVQNGIEILVAPSTAASGDANQDGGDLLGHANGAASATVIESGDAAATASIEPWIFIVGAVVILIIIAIVAGLLYFCWFKKRRQAKKTQKSGNKNVQKRRPPSPNGSKILSAEIDKKIPKTVVLKKDAPLSIEPTQEDSQEPPLGDKAEDIGLIMARLPQENVNNAGIYEYEWTYGFPQPWDYHAKEGPFKATIDFADQKVCGVPRPARFRNFWFCLGRLFHLKSNESPVFADESRGHEAVTFLKRDLVADTGAYAPFRQLANRILERTENDVALTQKKDPYAKKLKPLYTLRVFINYYEPVSLEVHCRGRCPLFLFEIFKECDECKKILNELQENNWLKSSATCNEDWDTFLCRVKSTPSQSHQFLSFNNPDENPSNPELINHIFVIRGAYKETRECSRKCSYSPMAHPNTYDIDRL